MIWVLLLVWVIASVWYSTYNLGHKMYKSALHEWLDLVMFFPTLMIFFIAGGVYKCYEWLSK